MRIAPVLSALFLAGLPGLLSAGSAYDNLAAGYSGEQFVPVPAVSAPAPIGDAEAFQYLPPDNDNPGFDWPAEVNKDEEGFYLRTGTSATHLKTTEAAAEALADNTQKCALEANTLYRLRSAPVFEAQHIKADLETQLPGCAFTAGWVYMPHVSSTSAGGLWELPRNVRAFLDTLAFSEGTREHYNYIYTYVTFRSYADHPRKKICSGGLCSTAAGRYQFLSKTWDGLAKDLALTDFTPPSQEKATIELIRRQGAYTAVANSSTYANFSKAITKLNTIWASLPGSPYGQPTHTMARLWTRYKAALASYQ
jgi:muramidase (phage lysozyme)